MSEKLSEDLITEAECLGETGHGATGDRERLLGWAEDAAALEAEVAEIDKSRVHWREQATTVTNHNTELEARLDEATSLRNAAMERANADGRIQAGTSLHVALDTAIDQFCEDHLGATWTMELKKLVARAWLRVFEQPLAPDAARMDGRNEGLMAAMECVEECGMPGWQSVNVHIASLLVITPTDANAAALPDAPTAPADPVTRIQDGAFGIVRFHDNGLQILTIGHAGEVENMVAVLREKTSAATDAPYAPTKAERCAAARARIGYAFAGVMDCARAGSKHDEHPYRWEVTIIADGKHGFYYGPDEPSALEAAADALEVAQ